ncbi:MAG: DNA polymerase III subunit alpha, partial [Patescibacteria group bacterium]|nr:DNA polymerase III subunit alpha [Patescibacteria group bacterium]
LEYSVPLQHPTQNDESIITQYEMHAIEDLGLLKMDFLGLKNLTIIEDTLNRIYAIHKKNIDIEKIPLDDKKTYKLLQRGETKGVFQLESSGMQRYLKQLKPTEFEDIIVMVALYRPGPMQFIPEYIGRKEKKRKIEYLHPKLKPILEKTQGICIFQEQLMKIAQELAGFSLSEADVLRKAVGKKIKKLLLKQKEKFIKGGIKNNINEKAMEKLWEWVLPFASYGFNRAHSTGYATISYQTAYLKSTFPLEFMSSLLTSEKNDTEGVALLIEECKKMGIEVLPPDINESFRNFTVVPGQNKIRFGLLAIKNIGSDLIDAIVEERKNNNKFKSIEDFINRMMEINLNKKFLESSIKAGIFDQMEERNMLLTNVEKILEWSRENQKAKMNGQIGLFENTKIDSSLHLSPAPRASKSEMLDWEKELLGLYISGHPLDIYKKFLEREAVSISDIKKEKLPDKEQGNPYNNWNPYNNNGFGQNQSWKKIVRVGGIISQIKRIITKNGKPMLFLKIEDLTDRIEVVVFPSITEANSLIFKEGNIIFISGKIDNRDGTKKIIAQEAEKIIEK